MLAYDENNALCEYEENSFIAVCSNCHKLYHRTVSEQIPGFREREYDNCPYCGYENGSSMSYDYSNSKLTKEELKRLKKNSLLDVVVNYCHRQYITTTCDDCDHNSGCPGTPCGNCKQCLEEVHYPSRYPLGRKDYECERMMHFYVCDYTAKYASEMLYLMRKSTAMMEIEEYHVLSIGCGACPDLMALERFCHETSPSKTISYLGIDINKRWKSIHEKIDTYKTSTVKKTRFKYWDAVTEDFTISDANVVVLQYIISHFYNTGQIKQINAFFQKLVDTIISHKQENVPMVILINDVNSVNRGRDYFSDLIDKLKAADFHGSCGKFYFDYKIVNPAQRYGERHASRQTVFNLPKEFDGIYQPWCDCSSAQLLIEVQ